MKLHRILILSLLLCSASAYGQIDSLVESFKKSKTEEEGLKITEKIISKCDSMPSCYDPLLSAIFADRKSNINRVALLRVFNWLIKTNKLSYTINLQRELITMTKAMDPYHLDLAKIYSTSANNFRFAVKLDSALYYASLAEDEFRRTKRLNQLWKPYHSRYLVFLDLKDYKKADDYLRAAYNVVKDSDQRIDKGFLLHSLLLALQNRGTKEEFDHYLSEFVRFMDQSKIKPNSVHGGLLNFFDDSPKGLAEMEERIRLIREDTISQDWSATGLTLADKYVEAKEFEKAKTILDEMTELAFPESSTQRFRQLGYYNLYRKMGKWELAFDAMERYNSMQEQFHQQFIDKNLADYEVKYQTQQKERQIVEQKLALTQSRQILFAVLGFALLGSILLFSWMALQKRRLAFQREIEAKEAEIKTQRIKELEQKNTLLSLNNLIEGQESERMRIAQDLHDGLGGLLTTVKAHFNSIQREIETIRNLNIYEKTNQLIDEACVEVRRIAHDMVPHSIKISGLTGALQDLRESIQVRGMECELEIHGLDENILSEQKANMVYRIIQEVTNNAIKHSGGNKIFIQVMQHDQNLHVLVEDNGKGFDINEVVGNKGLGLKSIDSRIKYLNGKINFDSAPGQGTTINLEVPLV